MPYAVARGAQGKNRILPGRAPGLATHAAQSDRTPATGCQRRNTSCRDENSCAATARGYTMLCRTRAAPRACDESAERHVVTSRRNCCASIREQGIQALTLPQTMQRQSEIYCKVAIFFALQQRVFSLFTTNGANHFFCFEPLEIGPVFRATIKPVRTIFSAGPRSSATWPFGCTIPLRDALE